MANKKEKEIQEKVEEAMTEDAPVVEEPKPLVTSYNIYQYSTADAEYVLAHSEKTINGYPKYWPTKDANGKKVVFSFVNAKIYGRDGVPIDDDVAYFDICDTDKFDASASDANIKIKFIVALLSPGVYVKGGVYYKGEYYVDKMVPTLLTKKVLHLMA